jgi:hypothetical protein
LLNIGPADRSDDTPPATHSSTNTAKQPEPPDNGQPHTGDITLDAPLPHHAPHNTPPILFTERGTTIRHAHVSDLVFVSDTLLVMAEMEPDLRRKTTLTVGRVNALGPALVSIATPAGQPQRIKMSSETVVVIAVSGTFEDVHEGARVVVKTQHGTNEAVEVVVLPAESRHGLPVVTVAPDSMTIKNLWGELFTVNTVRAQIDTTMVGTIGDIPMGSTIFVRARRADSRSLAADEIFVLPDDTAFGR